MYRRIRQFSGISRGLGRARGAVLCCVALGAVFALGACRHDTPPSDDELLGLTRPTPTAKPMPTDDADAQVTHLLVYRLLVAADAPLGPALDIALPRHDDAVARWHANGLAAAVVEAARWGDFVAALPPIVGRQTMRAEITDAMTPIYEGARLRSKATMTVSLGDAGRWRETLSPGAPRFLAQAKHRPDGGLDVTLIPQHYTPRDTLRIRPVAERMLDGLVLHQLRLERSLAPGDVLVIAPLPSPESDADADAAPVDGSQPPAQPVASDDESDGPAEHPDDPVAEGAVPDASDVPPPPPPSPSLEEQIAEADAAPVNDLARLLLEGRRAGGRYAVVLLITGQWPRAVEADP